MAEFSREVFLACRILLKYVGNKNLSLLRIAGKHLFIPLMVRPSPRTKVEDSPHKEENAGQRPGGDSPAEPGYDFTEIIRGGDIFKEPPVRYFITVFFRTSKVPQCAVRMLVDDVAGIK